MTDRLATSALMPDARVPTRAGTLVFNAKAMLLRLKRVAVDLGAPDAPRRLKPTPALVDAPVAARVRSPLWSGAGGAKEHALNAGKVQNLRAAIRRIDGVVVPAGATLSFWRQVGRPVRRRGFAVGRELREGCMIASVGGGLCQLSNALHEAALQAGIAVIERHAHTRVVPGSRAAAGRDATVFWNYLDLRLRADAPFRIEARLTADALELIIRGVARTGVAPEPGLPRIEANDCLSCGQIECHRHNPDTLPATRTAAWLVDAPSPEFATLIARDRGPEDLLLLPSRRFGRGAKAWPRAGAERTAEAVALRRAFAVRCTPARVARPALLMAADARLAAAYARRLSPPHTHLMVAQSLLPHLWLAGTLQGRSFDVLADRLPIEALQATLDAAHARHPESPTLSDFRAPTALAVAEREALAVARRIITPHGAVAAAIGPRAERIDWQRVTPLPSRPGGNSVLLAGSPLARKGIHALREALAGLDMMVLIPPGAEEAPDFWQGVTVRRLAKGEWPVEIAVAVLPAIIEHRPTLLMRAIAAGIPAVATPACGLPPQPGLTIIEPDDAQALRAAILQR